MVAALSLHHRFQDPVSCRAIAQPDWASFSSLCHSQIPLMGVGSSLPRRPLCAAPHWTQTAARPALHVPKAPTCTKPLLDCLTLLGKIKSTLGGERRAEKKTKGSLDHTVLHPPCPLSPRQRLNGSAQRKCKSKSKDGGVTSEGRPRGTETDVHLGHAAVSEYSK